MSCPVAQGLGAMAPYRPPAEAAERGQRESSNISRRDHSADHHDTPTTIRSPPSLAIRDISRKTLMVDGNR